jgi:hypothetical protein
MPSNNNIAFSTHQRIRRKMEARRKKAEEKASVIAEREKLLDGMSVKELREYAAQHAIGLGESKKKDDIKERILTAHAEMDAKAEVIAEEQAKLAAEREKQFGGMTVKELEAYADKFEIDVSGLKHRQEIRERIYMALDEAEAAHNNSEPENGGSGDGGPANKDDGEKRDEDSEGGDKDEEGGDDKPEDEGEPADGEGGDVNGESNTGRD